MRHVEPQVFLIAKTAPDTQQIQDWLTAIGADQFEVPSTEATAVGSLLVMLAGKRCYLSYQAGLNPNVTKVRQDLTVFIDNILQAAHGSTLEHVNYTFALENVSRVFTAEFNRHRAGMAVSEGSFRYIRFDEEIAYWVPLSIRDSEEDSSDLSQAKQRSREIFQRAFEQMQQNYHDLLETWNYEHLKEFKEKKRLTSLFRRIIGMGVATGGVWTGNLRALRHIFTMRCSPEAEEEICYVASLMLTRMIEAEPDIFGDFHLENGYWRPKHWKV